MFTELQRILLASVALYACCCLVICQPINEEEPMLNDDYDYDSDDPNSNQQSKAAPSYTKASNYAVNKSVSLTGVLGQNIVLKCDTKINENNVILWHHGNQLVTNGNSVVLPNFSLDPNTFDLTIMKASPQSAGDYYCEVLPQKVFLQTKVLVVDHLVDSIVMDNKTSAASNTSPYITFLWLLASSAALYHTKH